MTMHIDMGAEVTVISKKMWKSVGQPHLSPADRMLHGPDRRALRTLGKFTGTFSKGTDHYEEEIYVATGVSKSLLGQPLISGLELVK